MPGGTGSTQEVAPSADKIIDHKCGGPLDLADEKIARDDTSASPLIGQTLSDRPTEFSLQCLMKDVRTLGATRIRRNDTEPLIRQRSGIFHKQWCSRQRYCGAAKGVLEGSRVVDIKRDDLIRSYSFKHACHIARGHRVAGFGAAVFACVT